MASSVQIPVTQTGLEASIQAALRNAGKNATINLGANARQINALAQPLGRITGQADEFTKSMEAANARVFAFGASVGIINSVSSAFGALVKNTIAVEKSLTEINSVLNQSSSELDKFGGKLFEVAKNTGQSFDAVSKGALELARQGLGTEETLRRINDALILTRLSGLDAEKSVEGLTAAVNSFKSTGITTSEVLNKLVNVSQKYAVSEKDLIEGLKRSSSVAKQAGVSFDELVGIITAVQEKSAVGGAVIGNSFKTIFTRLQRTDTLDALQQLGVTVTDVQGRILPATKLLENLAVTIKGLNQIQLAEITEKVGGGFQIDKLIASLEDLGSASSVAFAATKLSAESANQAYAKNAALNKTLANLINETTLSAQELGATLGKLGITDSAKNLLGFFNNLLESLQKILGEESALGDFAQGFVKGIGNLVTGPGLALFGAIILKLSKDLAQFGFASLKSFFGIGKAAKEIEAVEKSVANALASNINLQRQLFALEGNRAAQIKVMTDAIVQQEAAMRRMASTSSSLAGPLYQAGVRGTNTGLRVPQAAGGYMPAVAQEASDINRGVGGARSGDRPVVIPNFNFGGGQRGSIVAHTGEYAVPNFAGSGGTAIFNRDMVRSMGMPSGAKKITAADGLIPNFASIAEIARYNPRVSRNLKKSNLTDQRLIASDLVNLSQNKYKQEFIPKLPNESPDKYEDRVAKLLGYATNDILKYKGSASVDGFIKKSNSIKLLEVKSGSWNSYEVLNKFLRALPENYGTNNPLDIWTKNKDDIRVEATIASPIKKNFDAKQKGLFSRFSSGFIPNFAFNADTVRQYASDIEKYRQGGKYVFPDGTSGYESQVRNVLSRGVAKATINKQAAVTKRKEEMQKKGAMDFFIDANSLGGIALVTPSRRGSTGLLSAESKMLNLPKKPDGVLMDDRLVIKNIQSTGVPTQKNFEQISSEINKLFAGPIVNLAQSLYGKLYSGASGSEFASQLGQLKSTSKGGILPPSAEGQIFEAAGKAALTTMNQIAATFDPRNENRPFDFTNPASMKEMLGVKAVRGDAKRAGGSEAQFKATVDGLVKKSVNDPQLQSGIFSQIRQQSKGRVLPENAAAGFVPNFVSKTREIGAGAEARFLRLGSKDGMEIGVKKFYKEGPKNAQVNEWLISQFINRYLNIPGVYGPKILSGFNASQRKRGIRKEIISGKLGKVALGGDKGRYFGLGTLRSAVKTKGLDLPDLHGANYILNSNAEKYLDGFSNYPTDAVGSLALLRDMASKGGVASIIDPGFARLTGSPAIDVIDQMLNYIDSKKKTAARGFLPNFANPLKEAVGREMAAGVPASQIYIDKSASLKSAANPMGLMVANRRDEPAGGYQGINRAIREGRDPKTYGAANGFVPNYVSIVPAVSKEVGVTINAGAGADAINKFASDAIKAGADLQKLSEVLKKEIENITKDAKLAEKIADASQKEITARLESVRIAQESRAVKVLENQNNKKLAKQLDKIYLEYNKSQKSASDLAQAQKKAAEVLKRTSLGGASQRAVVSSTASLAGSRTSAQPREQKDMLGTIFALQGAFSVLTGYTQDLTGKMGVVTKELTNLGSGISTAAFAYSGASDIVKNSSGKVGKALGNLGMAGAVAMGAFEVFKFGKELYNEFSGANERAAKSSIMLADAAANAAFSIDKYSAQNQESLKKTAEDIFKELNIRGLSDPDAETIKQAILQTLGTGASREAVQKSIQDQLKQEKVIVKPASMSSTYQVVPEVAQYVNKLNNGDLESVTKALVDLQQSADVTGISKLQDLILGGATAEDVRLNTSLQNTGFDASAIAGLLEKSDMGALNQALADVRSTDFGKKITEKSSPIAQAFNVEGVNWPRVLEFLNAVKKKRQEDEEAAANAAAKSEKQFKIDTSRFRAEQEFRKKTKFFTDTALTQEIAQKEAIFAIEQDLRLSEDEKQKKINATNAAYEMRLNALKATEEQQRNLNQAISDSLSGALNIAPDELTNYISKLEAELGNFDISQGIEELGKKVEVSLTTANIQSPGLAEELTKKLAEALVQNQLITEEQANQIKSRRISLDLENKTIDATTKRARIEAEISNAIEARQSTQLYQQELASLNNASEMLSINQEIEKIKNDYSLTEYERAKKTVALEKEKQALSEEGVDLESSKKRLDLEQQTLDKLKEQIKASKDPRLTTTKRDELILGGANVESLVNQVKGYSDIDAANIYKAYLQRKDIINREEELARKGLITTGETADQAYLRKKEGGIPEGMRSALMAITNEMDLFAYTIGEKIPQLFADNMSQAISQMIEEGKSFGEVLQGAAYNFVKEINSAMIRNLSQKAATSLLGTGKEGSTGLVGSFMNMFASGGKVSGGSGVKDDVPAMLMGGEYVINKKAVQKYGPQFLEALNNGTIGGYANGGKVQSGKGGFFTPGTYGLGGIQGTGNLLKFATQGYTSGAMDRITNVAGYQSIALEPESVRLTNLGRSNSPQAQATRAAKEQAFGLYAQEINAQMEAAKQAEAEKDAFKNQLIMLGVTAVGSYLGGIAKTGFQQGVAGAAEKATTWQKFTAGMSGVGEKFGNIGSGITSLFSGNVKAASEYFSMANTNFTNVLKGAEVEEIVKQISSVGYNGTASKPSTYYNPTSDNTGDVPSIAPYANPIGSEETKELIDSGLLQDKDFNTNGYNTSSGSNRRIQSITPPPINFKASGGLIPSRGGIDTIPAMLSGGEFIMNRSAAQNIGAGNLQALNAGAGSIVTEEKTEELNDKLIAKLDELIEASGGAGSITINVESSTGTANQTTSGQTSEQKQQLARQIKDAVVKVIQEEKRLGGSLRR